MRLPLPPPRRRRRRPPLLPLPLLLPDLLLPDLRLFLFLTERLRYHPDVLHEDLNLGRRQRI